MLNDDQIEEVRAFINSPTGEAVFQQMQASTIAQWMCAETPDGREECWRMLQAILALQNTLRDAEAMKRLTQRTQERRVYGTRTTGV
jgi:hypothetical protein